MPGQPVFNAASPVNLRWGAGERARFLIVDDEPALLRAMRRVLEAAGPGWEIVCARHGGEALERLSDERFHAVILDLQMPVMDGLTLLRHLAARYPEVQRIVHSSHIDPGQVVLVRLAHQVLAKPAHPSEIVDAVVRSLAAAADRSPGLGPGPPKPNSDPLTEGVRPKS